MNTKTILWVLLVIGGALILRDLFPRRIQIPSVPRIVTTFDTVRVLDTAWVTRLRHDTVKVNVIERVTVTVPETVRVVPHLTGLTALQVAPKIGDSTLATGFAVARQDSGYSLTHWQAQLYTLGPLKSLTLDSAGRVGVQFFAPPPAGCGLFCSLQKYAIGGGVGYLACAVRK